jgi:hypothetical protein
MGSQVNRLNLREQADRLHWVNITRDLTQQLDAVSTGVHFQSAEVMAVTQPVAGTELMRVAIRDLNIRNTRVPLCVVELGIQYKTLKSGPAPQVFFMDFRPWKGAVLPFASFKSNSQDEHGEFLRVKYSIAKKNNDNKIFDGISDQDQLIIKSFGEFLNVFSNDSMIVNFKTSIAKDIWVDTINKFRVFLAM